MSSPSQAVSAIDPEVLSPEIQLERMTPAEYAACRVAVGDRVQRVGSMDWAVAKSLFYRPVLRHEPYSPSPEDVPQVRWGGYQYAVTEGHEANSTASWVVFDDFQDYTIDKVGKKRRYLIKNAARHFAVRRIRDFAHLAGQGHAAYVSFYDRTAYRYQAQRRDRNCFIKWARAIYDAPKVLLLGGFAPDGLKAVAVAYWIGENLLFSTFFSDTSALKQGVGELMLHVLRESARQSAGVKQLVARPYQGGNGMDQYYLIRGGKVVQQPARLYLHPLTRAFMRTIFPQKYGLLVGTDSRGGNGADALLNRRAKEVPGAD